MPYDKPFKTYDEQHQKLVSDYKIISIDKDFEIEILKTFSYYNIINGYKEIFMSNNVFKNGTTFLDIIELSIHEKYFLTTLFKYSTYIEEFFKVKLAYSIGKNNTEYHLEYLKAKYYTIPKKRHAKFKSTVDKIKESFNTKDQPTRHYIDNHNHIPPWILFKNVYFNNVIDLFTFLPPSMEKEILDDYSLFAKLNVVPDLKSKNFKKMLTIVRKFRNKIAHNAKVFNYRVEPNDEIVHHEIQGILPAYFLSFKDINNGIGRTDLFAMIFSIIVLLDSKFLRNLFLQELKIAITNIKQIKYGDTYLSLANFPLDIEDRIDSMINLFKIN
jgi:hypothetical protein